MKVVIDTNVFISRILSPKGAPAKIFQQWQKQEFELLISKPILEEYNRVLNYKRIKKYNISGKDIREILKNIKELSINVNPKQKLDVIKTDPDDNKFLECAVEGKAEFIISGDLHLLALKQYQGIYILPPSLFVAWLKKNFVE